MRELERIEARANVKLMHFGQICASEVSKKIFISEISFVGHLQPPDVEQAEGTAILSNTGREGRTAEDARVDRKFLLATNVAESVYQLGKFNHRTFKCNQASIRTLVFDGCSNTNTRASSRSGRNAGAYL